MREPGTYRCRARAAASASSCSSARRARQDQTGVDEAGLAGAIDVGRLDRDRVRLLQAAETHDQLVEFCLLEPDANAVLAIRRLAGERRAEATLTCRAVDEHHERFVARCSGCRRVGAQREHFTADAAHPGEIALLLRHALRAA